MSETRKRAANFLKVFSMILVIGSLLYMYAYDTDKTDVIYRRPNEINDLTKEQVFYVGLGFFVVFNLIMHLLMYMYNNAKGTDPQSRLFRSRRQVASFSAALSFILAGINVFIASMVFYIAFVKINEAGGESSWIYLPIVGFVVLLISVFGLLRAFMTK